MAQLISRLGLGGKVKDPQTKDENGNPIIWSIIDFDHSGYPSNSVSLFAESSVKDMDSNESFSEYGYADSDVHQYLTNDFFENNISKRLKEKILETSIVDQRFISRYDKPIIDISVKIFVPAGYEIKIEGYRWHSSIVTFQYLRGSIDRRGNINSKYWIRDVKESNNLKILQHYSRSSSTYENLRYSFYSSELIGIRPIMNVTNTLMVSDTPDEDGVYVMQLIENKYLFKDGNEIKKYSETNLSEEFSLDWQSLGAAPATKAMFDDHGMKDLSIIDNAALQSLTSDTPEVLVWTDEEGEPNTKNVASTSSTPEGKGAIIKTTINTEMYYNRIKSIK